MDLDAYTQSFWVANESILKPVFPNLDAVVPIEQALGLSEATVGWGLVKSEVTLRELVTIAASDFKLHRLQEIPVVLNDPWGRLLTLPQPVLGVGPPFATIVADPPWQYGNVSAKGAAEKHYSTLTANEIMSMPISSLASDNAHLYLWCTNFFLADGTAAAVLKSWGFVPKTVITWIKTGRLGVGNYFRNSTEHMLFGVRGKLLTNKPNNERTHLIAPWIGHSRKPKEAYDLIARKSPGPYLELFARGEPNGLSTQQGWTRWGNEVSGGSQVPALDDYFKSITKTS